MLGSDTVRPFAVDVAAWSRGALDQVDLVDNKPRRVCDPRTRSELLVVQ